MTGSHLLCKNWCLLEEKNISSHAHKTASWYLQEPMVPLKDFFKISNVHLCPFYMGFVPRLDELGNVISIGRRVVPSTNRASFW